MYYHSYYRRTTWKIEWMYMKIESFPIVPESNRSCTQCIAFPGVSWHILLIFGVSILFNPVLPDFTSRLDIPQLSAIEAFPGGVQSCSSHSSPSWQQYCLRCQFQERWDSILPLRGGMHCQSQDLAVEGQRRGGGAGQWSHWRWRDFFVEGGKSALGRARKPPRKETTVLWIEQLFKINMIAPSNNTSKILRYQHYLPRETPCRIIHALFHPELRCICGWHAYNHNNEK